VPDVTVDLSQGVAVVTPVGECGRLRERHRSDLWSRVPRRAHSGSSSDRCGSGSGPEGGSGGV